MSLQLTEGVGYIAIGVTDPEEAVAFFTASLGLAVTDRDDEHVYLGGGPEHHWVELTTAHEPGWFRAGYRLTGSAALETVRTSLTDLGIKWTDGAGPHVTDAVCFTAPDGLELEFYLAMAPSPFAPSNDVLNDPVPAHVVYTSDRAPEAMGFLTSALGFRLSDQIEQGMWFLRSSNGYHHSIGVGRAAADDVRLPRLDHLCIHVADLDSVMRFRNRVVALGYGLRADLLRHTASGSMSVYAKSPLGHVAVEVCTGHELIAPDGRAPRTLPASPRTFDLWQPADLVELRAAAASRGVATADDAKIAGNNANVSL
jgi:catechol-2,3-dioxygenase